MIIVCKKARGEAGDMKPDVKNFINNILPALNDSGTIYMSEALRQVDIMQKCL